MITYEGDLQLSVGDFLFVAYKALHTEKNRDYNSILQNTNEKFVHVVFEKKTGYILTNNSKLHLELSIFKGVTQYDYDNNTDRLLEYVTCIDMLKKHEY